MLETLKHLPKAFLRELKHEIPIIDAVKKGMKGELVPEDLNTKDKMDSFKAGFMASMGIEKENAKGTVTKSDPGLPGDKERKRAFALGEVTGAAVRSLGGLGTFWVMFNGISAGASGISGAVGAALKGGAHGGILEALKGFGAGLLHAVTSHPNMGNLTAALAGGGSFLNMADGAFQSQSGAVNGSKKTMIDGKYTILQGLGIAIAATTGYVFVPVIFSLGIMLAKAIKDAKLEAQAEKQAKFAARDMAADSQKTDTTKAA